MLMIKVYLVPKMLMSNPAEREHAVQLFSDVALLWTHIFKQFNIQILFLVKPY